MFKKYKIEIYGTLVLTLLLLLIATVIRNMYFPVFEAFGITGEPAMKFVIGFPTVFAPNDFAGCVVMGPRFYIRGILAVIFIYIPVSWILTKSLRKRKIAT